MRVFLLSLLLFVSGCSGSWNPRTSASLDSLDAQGHCSKKLPATRFISLDRQLKEQVAAATKITFMQGGGFCGMDTPYQLEKVGDTWQLTIDDPYADKKEPHTLSEEELQTFQSLLNNLSISDVHPEGCRIAIEGCGDFMTITAGTEALTYNPASVSSHRGVPLAFLSDESFKAFIEAAKRWEIQGQ